MDNTAAPHIIGQRYQLLEPLGAGGMGTVYRGLDTQTGQPVAIKRLNSADPETLERFKREGEMLRQLNHPHIVKMLDMVEEGRHAYLIMELVDTGSLSDLLDQYTRLTIKQALNIGLDLSDALARAHRLNIIHRDIKPANVLLASDGSPRLTDFGIAQIRGAKPEKSLFGTLAYMAPELLQGEEADPRSDVWSFGVLLFEMLTGQYPFESNDNPDLIHRILTHPVPDLEHLRPDAPVALYDLIYRMLEKFPAKRISSVRQVGAELEKLIELHEKHSSSQQNLTVILDRFQTGSSTSIAQHNLPVQPTPFIGREADLASLAALLKDSSLVTIHGIGGMGKTRLAIEVAAAQLRFFSHGVYFVALAPLTSAEFIVSTIAEAVGFSFYRQDEDAKTQLIDYLREKHLLLVLDNFEHVMAGTALVVEMLQAAPHLKILVTSRERLNLRAEVSYPLGGMPSPEDDDAVLQLFHQSARRVQPDFDPDDAELDHIKHICGLVQGIPLGIELAAAWVKMLRVDEIASEIEQSLDFLETNMRDVPERHRSVRAVFEYSWLLLTADEQQVFMKLAIFRGGFTREAAQVIAGANLRTLTVLVDKSLLNRDASGRYHLHEMLRQYAEERLKEQTDLHDQVSEKHCTFYATFLRKQENTLWSPQEKKAVQEVEPEIENIRAGWNWAIAHHTPEKIEDALHALTLFYEARALYQEGVQQFEQWAVGLPTDSSLHWRIRVRQSWLAGRLGMFEASESVAKHALDVFRQHKMLFEMGIALDVLCHVTTARGHYIEALQFAERNLAIARELDHSWRVVRALSLQGYTIYLQGNYQEAKWIYQQVIPLTETKGSPTVLAQLCNNLGEVLHTLREEFAARQLFERSYALSRDGGNRRGAAVALNNLGNIAHAQGDLKSARRYYDDSLDIFRKIGDRRGMADSLKTLGEVQLNEGRYAEGTNSYQQSLKIYQAIGDLRGEGDCLVMLGSTTMMLGQYKESDRYLEESLAVRLRVGNLVDVADTLLHHCNTALEMGDLGKMERLNEESAGIILRPDFPVPQLIVRYIMNQGLLAYERGNYPAAVTHFEDVIERLEKQGYRWAIRLNRCYLADCLYMLGDLAGAQSNYLTALQLSVDIKSYDFGFYAIMGLGRMLAAQGQVERGAALIAFASESPLTWQRVRNRAKRTLQQLNLSPEAQAAALEHSKAYEFYTLAEELLETFAPVG